VWLGGVPGIDNPVDGADSADRPVAEKLRGLPLMLDFLMIAYGVGFFVVAIFYVLACERM
jgi:hypothetical protein